MAIGRSRYVEYALDPYIWFFYAAPIIAFYPLLIMWFGLGMRTVIVLTFVFAFFPIVSNTVTGVQEVDRVLTRAARAFGASKLQILWLVILPASIPAIAAGLRLGIGRALVGTVVGEFFGANAGLGYRIALYGTEMNIGNMFVPVVMVMIIGVLLLQLLQWVENSVATWRS
jgi:NitT/TauT family transport system permease protein